jgi:hypothetical protein
MPASDAQGTNQKTATFRDAKGDQWSVRLDFAGLRRIRDAADVDLGNVEALAQVWASLLYDDELALSVIWLCIQSAAEPKGVTKDDYFARMDGPVLQAALDALGEAVLNFTRPQKRGMAERAIREVTDGYKQAVEEAEKRIETAVQGSTRDALSALGKLPPDALESLATSTSAGRSAKP